MNNEMLKEGEKNFKNDVQITLGQPEIIAITVNKVRYSIGREHFWCTILSVLRYPRGHPQG